MALLAVVAAAALVVGACTPPAPMLQPVGETGVASSPRDAPSPDATAETDPELGGFYGQDPAWRACGRGGFQCTTIEAPLDYANPAGERIELAIRRLPATDESARQGSLVLNPGGPGSSGQEMVEWAPDLIGLPVRAVYDLVGFDPRGVGGSTAVRCLEDGDVDPTLEEGYDLTRDSDLDRLVADLAILGDRCRELSGELLDHVDTVSAARDLDLIRAVLGDEQLTYLGFSYGTLLGAVYADLFPERVRRLVLDGGIDPSLGYTQVTEDQTEGFELALRAYVADCLDGDCPLDAPVDAAMRQLEDFLTELVDEPLPSASEDGELRFAEAYGAIQVALYYAGDWPVLTDGLAQAFEEGDGSQLDVLAEWETADVNADYAFWAIDCTDYPISATDEDIRAQAEALTAISPIFGPGAVFGEVICREWPARSTVTREPLAADGAEPILVVGTARDPATPYHWSQALAEQLVSGRLLTWDGDGHTAYGSGSRCVDRAVDRYLLSGDLPDDGTVC